MANEARNRLRSMGGIMASSPELLQAQQQGAGYQQGGTVSPTVPVVGGPDRAMRMQQMLSDNGLTFAERMELSDQGTRVLPGGLETASEQSAGSSAGRLQNRSGPDYSAGDLAAVSGGSRARGQLGPSEPRVTFQELLDEAESVRNEADSMATGRGSTGLRERLLQQATDLESQAANLPGGARASAQEELQRSMPGGMRIGEEDPKRVADAEMEDSKSDRAEAQRRLQETRPEELLTMGGKLASSEELAPPPADDDNTPKARRTLRDRYDKRMELFKDIFGESDEARARDRAMSLAMTGLAIASGQSPNALTNIAQGAMAGVQGMSEQEQARREHERGLKTLAFKTALEDMSAEQEAEQRAVERQQDAALELELARMDSGSDYGTVKAPQNAFEDNLKSLREMAAAPTSPFYGASEERLRQLALDQVRITYGNVPEVEGIQQRAGGSQVSPEVEAETKKLLGED